MKETLVKIKYDSANGVVSSVSGAVQELSYEGMVHLRQAFCLAIAECEELYQEKQQ